MGLYEIVLDLSILSALTYSLLLDWLLRGVPVYSWIVLGVWLFEEEDGSCRR